MRRIRTLIIPTEALPVACPGAGAFAPGMLIQPLFYFIYKISICSCCRTNNLLQDFLLS